MPTTTNEPANEARLQGAARGLSPSGLIAVAWSGWFLAAMFVGLRCFVRITETRRLHTDDYWVIAAFILLTANAVLQTLQTPSLYYLVWASAGRVPAGEELIVQGSRYTYFEFVIIALFWTITWSVKSSFLAMYWRLFDGLPNYRKVWFGVVIFAVGSYIGCWFASVWTCHPPSTYFKFGQCAKPIDVKGSVISISYSTAVDVLTDLMIMALPIGLLPSLQVNRQQKIGLAGIFCVGFIVIAAALLRLSQIVGQARSDPVGLAVWGLVESSISVVVGTLPALKTFFGRALDRTLNRGSAPLSSERAHRRRHTGMDDIYDGEASHKSWARAEVIPLADRGDSLSHQPSTKSVRGQIVVEREWT